MEHYRPQDREKEERDAAMSAFLRRKLVDHINAPAPTRIAVNIELPLVAMTPEETKEAGESMKSLQEEDR